MESTLAGLPSTILMLAALLGVSGIVAFFARYPPGVPCLGTNER